MSLSQIDPSEVFFTFSRLRPKFSCGRRVQDTINAILSNELRAEDLPPISVLLDPATQHMFSLNNRRLYVFKTLQAEGRLKTIPVRIKPVPQTKRMKDKYTAEKCVKTAKLMLEREVVELLGSDDKIEGVNDDDESKTQGSEGSEPAKAKQQNTDASATREDNAMQAGTSHTSSKPPKPVRNMDDWTDEEDIGKTKSRKRGTKSKKKQ